MTDEELKKLYKSAPVKALVIVQIAMKEGTDILSVADRLQRLGIDAKPGLRRAFHRYNIQNITQEDVNWYLRKYGKHPEDEKPQEGCVDDFCRKGNGKGPCRYLDTAYGYASCAYYTATGLRRGCKAGSGCGKYEARRRRKETS